MKKKLLKKGTSLMLVAAVFISAIAMPAYATISEEKDNLKNLEKEKEEVQKVIDNLNNDKKNIEQNIKSLDAELNTISLALYQTEKDLASVEKKIGKNEKKLKKAQKSITEQYASMKLRIKFMYENGNQEIMSLILSSESIGDFLNKAEYVTELSSYDRKMLDKMQQTKKTIEKTQATLKDQKSTLDDLKIAQEQRKSDVEKLVVAKQNELAVYDSKLAQSEHMMDELDTAIGDKQEVIKEMERIEAERKAAAAAAAAAAAKNNASNNTSSNNNTSNNTSSNTVVVGGYTWPLPGYARVSSAFGYRADPFSGKTSYHSGIDIPAPAGTPIVAANSGEVAWSNYSSTAGNWVGIDHGNGVYTVYMHMSASLVSAGQQVSKGQTIGLVGTTGSSTGNHLHFSVRVGGAYVNPSSYVSP